MSSARKLGADRSPMGLVPAMVTLVSIAVVWIALGKEAAFKWTFLAFVFFTFLAAVAWYRTRSLGYLASLLYLLSCSLMLAVRVRIIPGQHEVAPAFAILLMASIIFLVFMLLTKQVKWRGRDILELAARAVDETAEGYTGRPHPVGKVAFERNEILDFAAFARRKLIAMTYVEPDRIVFVPIKMGSEFGYLYRRGQDYRSDTWIAFGNEGNVTVNISQADYLAYTEELDFDQLCRSLADVFIEFLELHAKGHEVRIMDRMDAMKIGVFS